MLILGKEVQYPLNDTDLQKITRTQMVGLQKTEVLDFSLSDKSVTIEIN